MKDKFKIENYKGLLTQVCDSCNKAAKCKDHEKLCMRKKFTFNIAKYVYKQRVKKGEIDANS